MQDIFQLNKLAKFHNGKNIFFCKTDYLEQLFDSLRFYRRPSILISGNSDYPITDEVALKAPSCVHKWFAQSVNTTNPLVSALPYGIENDEHCLIDGHGLGHQHAKKKIEVLLNPPKIFPQKKIYANFSLNTHPVRKEVSELCKSLTYITTKICPDYKKINNLSYDEFAKDILEHEMAVCPRGNAPAETHRFWEVLHLNRVPIIKRNMGNSFFTELPVIVLEAWDKLADLDYLNSEYERVKNNSREMLYMTYWERKILNECK